MTSAQGRSRSGDPIARRCIEVLDQMTGQLIAGRKWGPKDQERLQRIKADFTKLVHWALHDQGNPSVVAQIRDCYRRCEIDVDDTAVLRRMRGAIKGELRKAGIDTTIPGLDPALDAATIILTTKRTIQKMGASSTSVPGPALDPKPAQADATAPPPPPPPAAEPPPPMPQTVRRPRKQTATTLKDATPSEILAAFDKVVAQALGRLQQGGRTVARSDYVAAVYNDAAKKARFLDQIADLLPPTNPNVLGPAVDSYFRAAFKNDYIERTDREGHRHAHKR